MKRISSIALFAAALLSGTTSILAQETALAANIPFNFAVGETVLPPGRYIITSPSANLVEIQNSTDRRVVVMASALHDFHESNEGTKLVFVKYDDQYFLRQIRSSAMNPLNVDFPAWKTKKLAQQLEAARRASEQTVIATR